MFEIEKTEEFINWLHDLKDRYAKIKITKQIEKLEDGNFGDYGSVGDGVSEIRLHFGSG